MRRKVRKEPNLKTITPQTMEGDLLNAQPVAEVDYSRSKITILGGIGVIVAIIVSFALSRVFIDPSPLGLGFVTLAAGLLLVVVFLEALLIKEFSRLASFLFLNILGLSFMFLLSPSVALFVGSALAYLFFLWGAANARWEVSNSLKLYMTRASWFLMPKAVTALSFFIAAAYIGAIQHSNAFVSRDLFVQLVSPMESVVHYLYPGVTFSGSTGQAIQAVAVADVQRNPDIQHLSQLEKDRLVREYASDFKRRLSDEYIKIDIRDEESVIDLLYRAFSAYIANIPDTSTAPYASTLFGLILFLVIRSIGTPFYYLVTVFAVLVYEMLRASGFLLLALETRTKEILILK